MFLHEWPSKEQNAIIKAHPSGCLHPMSVKTYIWNWYLVALLSDQC